MTRATPSRRAAGTLVAGGVLAGLAGACAAPNARWAPAPDSAAGATASPGPTSPFPPQAPPFDGPGRLPLVLDHLTFLEGQDGLFPGRAVHLLPVAPWVADPDYRASTQQWTIELDGSVPLSLLAHVEPSGALDVGRCRVTVDGAAVGDLADYVLRGVDALYDGAAHRLAVLHLVLPALSPGNHRIEVHAPAPAGKPAGAGGLRQQTYSLTVTAPASLGAGLLQGDGGALFVTEGASRRALPDEATGAALGFGSADIRAADVLPAHPATLSHLAAGRPIPALRDGLLVRAAGAGGGAGQVFRLRDGRREWLPDYREASPLPLPWVERPREVDAAVVQSVPPLLRDGMLIRGNAPDVFHVERGALRKVPPGAAWLRDQKLDGRPVLYVPDRIVAALPQGSPHWRQPGGVSFDRAFVSETLGRSMPYRIFLPPEYDASGYAQRRYPVLYLLHGNGGRYDEWSGYGLEEVANELLAQKRFGQVIVVMPQGGRSYWVNQEGGLRWGDYVARDVVRHVDATYRSIARREGRAVGGLSMGGHGALQLTLTNPAVFGIAGAHSPSLPTRDNAPPYFGGPSGFPQRDPFALARVGPAPDRPPQFWIDVGEADRWRRDAEAVHRALDERGWAHEWRLFSGSHDGSYWGDHLWEYLPFYAQAFARNGVLPA